MYAELGIQLRSVAYRSRTKIAMKRLAFIVLTTGTTLSGCAGLMEAQHRWSHGCDFHVKISSDTPGVDVYCSGPGGRLALQGTTPFELGVRPGGELTLFLMKDGKRAIQVINATGPMEHHIKWQDANPQPLSEDDKRVFDGKISVGMSAVQVMWSWGVPNKKNTTTTSVGTHEQWIYGNPLSHAQYVYLENGVLTTIQESK